MRADLYLGQEVFVARLSTSDEPAELPSDWLVLELCRCAWIVCEHGARTMALEAAEAAHGDVQGYAVSVNAAREPNGNAAKRQAGTVQLYLICT